MSRLFILTIGFEEKFAIRMITRHGLDIGDKLLIITGPIIDKVEKTITFLKDFIAKYYGKEIELEASYIPLGTTQPVISQSWSGTITVSTDIISIDLASSETEPIMTRVILNPPAGTCKEGEEITLTGELLGMLSEEHSTPYTFPIVGASIKIYDADIGLEDLKFGPDLLASGTTDLQGRFTVTWTCQVTDWILIWPERTVEIYASFEGNERLLSSSSQQYTVQVEE